MINIKVKMEDAKNWWDRSFVPDTVGFILCYILLFAVLIALSFGVCALLTYGICWAFGLEWSWMIAFGVWLITILARGIFGNNK